ncbi:hypothetical protein BH23GEM9_BH23GEM9_10960 [soil metagenome]
MVTLSEYFETEAREAIAQIVHAADVEVDPDAGAGDETGEYTDAGTVDAGTVYRAARTLRGTAQMAREERVQRVANALETAMKAVTAGDVVWSAAMRNAVRASVADLNALLQRAEPDDLLDERVQASVERWHRIADVPPERSENAAQQPAGETGDREFRQFAAREVAGIADALERGIQQLAAAPMDREALKVILRRQRALLGARRLDEIPVVAEILRAVEDLTRVVAKLDVGVKQEWLDVYRVARDGLRAALEALQRDENPASTNAASRLRHMREELLERYGTGEAVSAAHPAGLVQARPLDQPPAPVTLPVPEVATARDEAAIDNADRDDDGILDLTSEDEIHVAGDEGETLELGDDEIVHAPGALTAAGPADPAPVRRGYAVDSDGPDLLGAASSAMQRAAGVVPVEELYLTTEDALRQAMDLREPIMRATKHDPEARAAAEELFDLIRFALG